MTKGIDCTDRGATSLDGLPRKIRVAAILQLHIFHIRHSDVYGLNESMNK